MNQRTLKSTFIRLPSLKLCKKFKKLKKYKNILFKAIIFLIIFKYLQSVTVNYGIIDVNNVYKCEPILDNVRPFSVVIDKMKYPRHVPLYRNTSLNFDCLNQSQQPKVILFWNTWFGDAAFGYGLGKEEPFLRNKCPVTNCELTNDKSRLEESQLVVFHMRDTVHLSHLRYNDQRWVFLLFESPVHSYEYTKYNGRFNMSVTYKPDSDIYSSVYGEGNIVWQQKDEFDQEQDFYKDRTHFAFIVVSNCGGNSERFLFLAELKKHIDVDIYGSCGSPCPSNYDNGTAGDCKEILSQKYKFYLAFENSLCNDYISEKFYKIFNYTIIPVVYGLGPYDIHVPKSGYINALDYESPKDLANYLIHLDSDRTAYNSYFKWRKYMNFDPNESLTLNYFCDMCIKLNLEEYFGVEKKTIEDMYAFWGKKSQCKRAVISASSIKLVPYFN